MVFICAKKSWTTPNLSDSQSTKYIMEKPIYLNKFDNEVYETPINILRRQLYTIFVWLFCVIMVVLVCFDWIENYYDIKLIAKPATRAFLFSLFLIALIDPGTWKRGTKHFLVFPLTALAYLFLTYAIADENLLSGLYYSSKIIYWIAGTFFVYRMLLTSIINCKQINRIVSFVICIYSIMIFYFMFNPAIKFSQNINIYALLWCIPILMLSENTSHKKFLIVFAYISVFLSFKRGAVVALTLSTFVYLICLLFN